MTSRPDTLRLIVDTKKETSLSRSRTSKKTEGPAVLRSSQTNNPFLPELWKEEETVKTTCIESTTKPTHGLSHH